MRTLNISLLLSVSVLMLAHSRAVAEPVTVGVMACLSGPCAEWGEATRKGLQLALDDSNPARGELGPEMKLLFEDTNEAIAATQAVTAFRKLRATEKANFFIGPTWVPAGLALAPIIKKMSDVVIISPSLGVSEFNEAGPNIFKTMMSSVDGTRALARVARDRGCQRASIFSSEQPWDNSQGKAFQDEYVKLGGQISLLLEPNPSIKDLKTESLRIIASKPECVVLTNFIQMALAAKQLKVLGYNGPLYLADVDTVRVREASGALEGAVSAKSPATQSSFQAKYRAKYGTDPEIPSDTAYDALAALGRALATAGASDPVAVREALLRVDFEGASGRVRFDSNGGAMREPRFVYVSGASLKPLEKEKR